MLLDRLPTPTARPAPQRSSSKRAGPRSPALIVAQLQRTAGNHAVSRALALQRKVTYLNVTGDPFGRILRALTDIQQRLEEPVPMTDSELVYGLVAVNRSRFDYGVIDPDDEQHLKFLYYYVRKQAMPQIRLRAEREGLAGRLERPGEPVAEQERAALAEREREEGTRRGAGKPQERVFRTAFLGAGATVAYWIATLSANTDPRDAIVIGPQQPWAGTRGEGVVAHPENMISPMLRYVGEQLPRGDDPHRYDRWLERAGFSRLIEHVLHQSGFRRVHAPVTGLRREGQLYEITVGEGPRSEVFYASAVIAGTGVGGHRPPAGVREEQIVHKEGDVGSRLVMDMDMFTRVMNRLEVSEGRLVVGEGRDQRRIRLILSGGNGGIDVAFEALRRGMQVHWIVGGRGPFFLPGFPNIGAYAAYRRAHARTQGEKPPAPELQGVELEQLERLYAIQTQRFFADIIPQLADREFAGIYFDFLKAPDIDESGVIARLQKGGAAPPSGRANVLVYAQGQDYKTFRLLERFMGDLRADPDVNRRFAVPGERRPGAGGPPAEGRFEPQAAIGLRSGEGSLRVVGALAFRLLPRAVAARLGVRSDALTTEFERLPSGCSPASRDRAQAVVKTTRDVAIASGKQREADREDVTPTDEIIAGPLRVFAEACQRYDAHEDALREHNDSRELARLTPFRTLLTECRTEVNTNMEPVIRSLPGNVLINDQLTPSRSQIVAARGFVPLDIARRVDFFTADRTELAIHISARCPEASPADVHRLVEMIIAARRQKAPPDQTAFQEQWEAAVNDLATQRRGFTKAAL
jgi:hypothetical protein